MKAIVKYIAVLVVLIGPLPGLASTGGWCMVIVTLGSCGAISDEYRAKAQDIITRLRSSTPEISEELQNCPEDFFIASDDTESFKNRSQESKEETVKFCDEWFTNAQERLLPQDDRFSTPIKTWELFISSLLIGNSKTAISCLTETARKNYSPYLAKLSDEELKEFGKSFKNFHVLSNLGDEIQDAMATHSNGNAVFILFGRQGWNWKIAELN